MVRQADEKLMRRPRPEFECYRCGFCCLQHPCDWGRCKMTDRELHQVYTGHGYCKFLRIAPKTFKATCTLLRNRRIGAKVRRHNEVGRGCLDWQAESTNGRPTTQRLVNWMRARRIYLLMYGTLDPKKMSATQRRLVKPPREPK